MTVRFTFKLYAVPYRSHVSGRKFSFRHMYSISQTDVELIDKIISKTFLGNVTNNTSITGMYFECK